MISVLDYLSFENQETLAVAVGFLVFIIIVYLLGKMALPKGPGILIAFAVAAMATWKLYKESFYGWEGFLAFVIIIAVLGVLLKILIAFFKNVGRSFGKR